MDEELIESAISAYSRANAVLEPLRIRVWEAYGITISQLRLMHLIGQKGDPSLGELALELSISGPTLSGLVDRLVRRRLVVRSQDVSDRRVVRVCLSPEGQSLSSDLELTGRALLRRAFESIGPDAARRLAADLALFADAVHDLIASDGVALLDVGRETRGVH